MKKVKNIILFLSLVLVVICIIYFVLKPCWFYTYTDIYGKTKIFRKGYFIDRKMYLIDNGQLYLLTRRYIIHFFVLKRGNSNYLWSEKDVKNFFSKTPELKNYFKHLSALTISKNVSRENSKKKEKGYILKQIE